ncbi:MAG TPA: hypothetical protein VHM72_08825 [Solirubrobacteraceae bacterium]|nr:hypothetical protein [Solirubrobacteraceae bacterium]
MALERRALAPALCLLAVLAVSATAVAAATQLVRKRSGSVSATLSYRHEASNAVAPFSDLRLTITRDGKPLYRAAVTNDACGTLCWPNLPDALRVVDVEADGQPDVLLNLYTGGAHCCNATDVFRYDAAREDYSSLLHVWGDPGYSLTRLNASKVFEFVTADDRFAYEFAAFAFSGLPVEVLALENGRFVDVTRAYPRLLVLDAARQWRSYRDNRSERTGLGFLAAWAADEYLLGRGQAVGNELTLLERAGKLRSSGPRIWPAGAEFVARLRSFLRKTGYTS